MDKYQHWVEVSIGFRDENSFVVTIECGGYSTSVIYTCYIRGEIWSNYIFDGWYRRGYKVIERSCRNLDIILFESWFPENIIFDLFFEGGNYYG